MRCGKDVTAALRPRLRRRQRVAFVTVRESGPIPGSRVSSLLLPQMLGYHRAAEVMLLGDALKADAALATGLVNRVMPPAEVNAFALAQARKLTAQPMSSLLEIKRLMKKGQATLVKAQMAEEGASFARMLKESAAKGAFKAFLEKRKPDFSRI